VRDEIVEFMKRWAKRTELPIRRLVRTAGLGLSKFYNWKDRYGLANEHNAPVPRDPAVAGLQDWEKLAITDFAKKYPLEGYRRLCFMMLERDIVACSPTSPATAAQGVAQGRAVAAALQALPQGHRLCATAPTSRALAH